MADEGLANIELELRQTKPQANFANNQTSTLEKIRQLSQTHNNQLGKKKEIHANFNLSFSNSFNNSYGGQPNNQTSPGLDANNTAMTFSATQIKQKWNNPPKESPHESESQNGDQKSPSNSSQQQPHYQGYFTADAIYLEKQLTNRLKEASNNQGKKMQAFDQTFNEIIKRDKNFGSLLLKIKSAYDDYLRKSTLDSNSPPLSTNNE